MIFFPFDVKLEKESILDSFKIRNEPLNLKVFKFSQDCNNLIGLESQFCLVLFVRYEGYEPYEVYEFWIFVSREFKHSVFHASHPVRMAGPIRLKRILKSTLLSSFIIRSRSSSDNVCIYPTVFYQFQRRQIF